ncbi:hydrogenase maturation nickel metallochaperone HypA [Ectothiorhodospira shaposhnikovii]|uniref:hydrogenase maturation nickel metallochaperone HypA n=1 Tax=Ectothiorhodospira shaposhnikovii TaxID=1054 RepID=UPI001F5B30D9|nr:hydrogenase maturation nickel metallochaperone HypA [Ectothiorhodospira shaposhnikovii]MBK1674539.1 hydrogenase maturation nickel metallochaperone HypA [Ectothiorhodospira shaposhnikovii]
MSIAESLIQLLEEQALAQQFSRVRKLWLEIGPLASVDVPSLQFCFEAVSRHTLAEAAVLEIIEVPGLAWCLGCEARVDIHQRFDACPKCGSYRLQVIQGDELRVKELEVD